MTEVKVREIIAEKKVPRSITLIDACRERLTKDIRAGAASPRSSAVLLEELGKSHGHVVMSAAAANQYAYDANGNGVFTAAVIDGLRCAAERSPKGLITVEALHHYVENRVLNWIQKHRNGSVRKATQLTLDGDGLRMPLSACVSGKASEPRTH